MAEIVRKRVRVTGVVQGVGFRPFVWRRATGLGLAGWVENDSAGVVIEVEGPADRVGQFVSGLAAAAPPLAAVARVAAEGVAVAAGAGGLPGPFAIRESVERSGASTPLPPDIATCDECRAEVADPANRRHRHPFTNCTNCGPRYTIIEDLPYDRAATTMRSFPMCPRCAAEYHDPADRRFHAQPNACPDCGPTVWFAAAGMAAGTTERSQATVAGDEAIAAAQRLIRDGRILAVKGLGGFHLACDATNPAAVSLLRERKHRVGKPLAVMVGDAAGAAAIATVDGRERRLLESRERPIVLLRKAAAFRLAADVAPGNEFVGVVLPYSPLHQLLCAGMPPLVMTSGNLAEEPIVHDNAAAANRLAAIADGFLMHDRRIHVACDDSVVRCVGGGVLPIRRSRGYAPLPVALGGRGPSVLAVGGELKAAICVTRDDQAFMSQHIGDMGNLETLESLAQTADHLLRLFRIEPQAVVADLHPGYLSTAWARQFAAARAIPLVQAQHHEAHVAALIAERGGLDAVADGFIGVCFDGTGYGHDGTIWGGEFFVAEGGRLRRAAHLAPFPLPGGDAGIRHPWRAALAMLHAAGVPWDPRLPAVRAAGGEAPLLRRQLERNLNCVATSSMGRLFDAVASLAGVRHAISYEAEAALNLETLAVGAADACGDSAYAFASDGASPAGPVVIAWQGLVAAVADDVLAGVSPARIAARFHAAVAAMVVQACCRLRTDGAGSVVGLTGGVFQNALLAVTVAAALQRAGFAIVSHRVVPPNDGGLALGQAVLAHRLLTASRR